MAAIQGETQSQSVQIRHVKEGQDRIVSHKMSPVYRMDAINEKRDPPVEFRKVVLFGNVIIIVVTRYQVIYNRPLVPFCVRFVIGNFRLNVDRGDHFDSSGDVAHS